MVRIDAKMVLPFKFLPQVFKESLLPRATAVHNSSALRADKVMVPRRLANHLVVFLPIPEVHLSENTHAQEKVQISVHGCNANLFPLFPEAIVHLFR